MGIDKIISMVMRTLVRRAVNSGVNMGINAATGAFNKPGRKGHKQAMMQDDYHVDEVQRRRSNQQG